MGIPFGGGAITETYASSVLRMNLRLKRPEQGNFTQNTQTVGREIARTCPRLHGSLSISTSSSNTVSQETFLVDCPPLGEICSGCQPSSLFRWRGGVSRCYAMRAVSRLKEDSA